MARVFALLMLCLYYGLTWIGAQPLPELIPYKAAGGWGYSDSNKVLRLPAIYSSAELFYEGKALVSFDEGSERTYCVIDERGRYIIPRAYHWVGPYVAGGLGHALNAHDSSGRLGMIDTAANIIMPFIYDPAPLVQSGYCSFLFQHIKGYPSSFMIVGKGGHKGIIDTLGHTLIPFEYEDIRPSRNINAFWNDDTLRGWVVRQKTQYGVLRADGRPLFSPRYDAIYPVYEKNWAIVRVGRRFGAVDTTGRMIVPARYDTLVFNGGAATTGFQTMLSGKWGWHDVPTGKAVPPAYNSYDDRSLPYGAYGYVVAGTHNDTTYGVKWMLLSGEGKLLVPPLYDRIRLYQDSVLVFRYMSLDSGRTWHTYQAELDKKTRKPGRWHIPSPDNSPVIWAAPEPEQHVQVRQEGEYYLPRNGKGLRAVTIDGETWDVTGYLAADDPAQRSYAFGVERWYYPVTCHSPKGNRYAAVDSSLRFVLPPQRRYEILGGNFFRNTIITRRQDGLYVVTDTAMRRVSRPVSRQISDYVRWRGRHYILGAWQPGQPVLSQRAPYSFRGNCITVLDSRGNIVPGFESLCIGRFSLNNREPPPLIDQNGTVLATDSLGHSGYINQAGEVQYPAVSFKYHQLYKLSDKVFRVNSWKGTKLVNAENADYLPLLHDIQLSSVSAHPVFPTFTKQREYRELPGLIGILQYSSTYPASTMYMDIHGTIYADEAALK